MHSFDRKGVHSAMICEETKHDEEMIGKVLKGLYPLFFFTPESLLTVKKWRRMLSNEVYSEKLKALVFDEAHCIAKWYESIIYNVIILKIVGERHLGRHCHVWGN